VGGYGSGGHNRKRATAEGCVRLDAAMLRRAGMLSAAPVMAWAWSYTSRGERSAWAVAKWQRAGDMLHVMIIPTPWEPGQPLPDVRRHAVPISRTDCTFGKSRAWMHCPACGRRVFRLFHYPRVVDQHGQPVDMLSCRQCLRLSYDLWQARGFDRDRMRCERIVGKLTSRGAVELDGWRALPFRPRGMHRRTYKRIEQQYDAVAERAFESYLSGLADMLARAGYELPAIDGR
jgi:hypothetical protein